MNCSEAQSLLQDLLDGRLRPDQEREVHAHVASCAACKQELDLYRQVFDALAAEPTPAVQLADRIMEKVASEPVARRPALWAGWTAAAACILVAIGAWLVVSPPSALTDPLRELMAQVGDLAEGWDEGAQGAYVAAVDNCLDAWATAVDAARQFSPTQALGSVPLPQIPVLVVIAACVAALTVNLYYLRRGSPPAATRMLAL